MLWVGIFLLNEVLGRSYEVVKYVLSLLLLACCMPLISKFTAATSVRDDLNSIHVLVERNVIHRELRLVGLSESTISVKMSEDRLLRDHVESGQDRLLPDNGHWNDCAILTFVLSVV